MTRGAAEDQWPPDASVAQPCSKRLAPLPNAPPLMLPSKRRPPTMDREARMVGSPMGKAAYARPMRPRRWSGRTQLAGGEQKVRAIGAGLMARPEFLLLDEPTLGFAPVLAERSFKPLRSFGKPA